MKRLLLILLALVMCLSIVACDKKNNDSDDEVSEEDASDGASIPADIKKVAKTYIEILYGDGKGKAEDFAKVCCAFNLDLLELIEDEDKAEDLREEIEENLTEIDFVINDLADYKEDEDYKNFKFDYKFLNCTVYDRDSETFDNCVRGFVYSGTDIEDYITEVAVVNVLTTIKYKKDDEQIYDSDADKLVFYKIDDNWYIEE